MEFGVADQERLVRIVRDAARDQILPRFRNLADGGIRQKSSPDDLVTEADTEAEAQITQAVREAWPQAVVVGEEAVAADPSLAGRIGEAELAVIIDPVDGTWNFAKGLAVFGVIVAVTRFGRCVFGALYDPIADDWVAASADGSAELVRATGIRTAVRVSRKKPLDQMTGHVPLFLMPEDRMSRMGGTYRHFSRVQTLGCSCHEYRFLALGLTDFCLSSRRLNSWDHAAGALICQRAGGVSRMLDGRGYDATLTDGYLLTAPDPESWERIRDVYGFLLD